MDFMALFTIGTGGHYITILSADWSISTSHDPLSSSCHSEKMLWNLSIVILGKPAVVALSYLIQGVHLGLNIRLYILG